MIDPIAGYVVFCRARSGLKLAAALRNDFSWQNARQANKDGASLAVRSQLCEPLDRQRPTRWRIQKIFQCLFNGLRFITLSSHCLTRSSRSLTIRPPSFKIVSTLARRF
jgi:hypothetical protein